MKNLTLALMTLALTTPAFAEGSHPCKQIVSACEAAGFTKGGHKNKKGLWKDCVGPIKNGKTVEGVTVDSKIIDGCKAKAEERKEKKESEKSKS